MASKKLGALLLEHGLVTQRQLNDALQAQMVFGGRLGTNLIELGYLSANKLAEFLSAQLGLPCASAAEIDEVPKETLEAVNAETASKYLIFPLAVSGRRLRLAMVDPTDLTAIDEIRFKTGFTIQPAVAPEVLVLYALEKHYDVPRPSRYLRLDRNAEAEMMESHRAAMDPSARRPESVRRTAQAQGTDPGIPLGEPEETPGMSIEAVAAQLVEATDHPRVMEVFRDALSQDFTRVAVFGLRGATAVGWLHAGLDGPEEEFRRISFTLEEGLDVTQVIRGRVARLAQIGNTPIQEWLLKVISAAPDQPLLFLPVSAADQPLLFAICHSPRAGLVSKSLGKYARLLRKVAAALQMLNYRKQILES